MVFCELINVYFPGSQNFSEPIKTLSTMISKYQRGPQYTNWYRAGFPKPARDEEHPRQRTKMVGPLTMD